MTCDIRCKRIAIGLILAVLIILLVIHYRGEAFTTKREKASAIIDWANSNIRPRYVNYRRALGGNIVEYDNVIKLVRGRNLTVNNVMQNI